MTILNNENDGLYPELIVLFRAIAHSKRINPDELIDICTPYKGKDGSTKRVAGSLSRWESLALFERVEDKIQIRPELLEKKRLPIDELTSLLPSIVRQLLMHEENCLPLWDDSTDSEKGNGIAADFVRGVAWILSQNIYEFPKVWNEVEIKQNEQVLNRKKIFQNDFRFNAFRHWSRYLGFASGEGNTYRIDPTMAIKETLPLVFGSKTELPGKEFLDALNRQLPILDYGRYRTEIENEINPSTWRKPSEGHLSMSLSFALRRLQLSKAIDLEGRSDARSSYRLTGTSYRTWIGFESVIWRGGKA